MKSLFLMLTVVTFFSFFTVDVQARTIEVGVRPHYLISQMNDSALKEQLASCKVDAYQKSDFSIGHRGAPLQFPEHTKESYLAAAKMGAGVIECDVTFTKDKTLVCRHSQCDLHQTTDVLAHPELAKKCSIPFQPGDKSLGAQAQVKCCTSDFTKQEFLTLKGKMEGANEYASTPQDYLKGTPNWRTDLYAATGTLMTHQQSIELFKQLGVKMTPELKTPNVIMPFHGYSQADFATQLIKEYKQAGVSAKEVFIQSFELSDLQFWLKNYPDFSAQAVYLDDSYELEGFDPNNPSTWQYSMGELKKMGVNIIAPPLWILVSVNTQGRIVETTYAVEAKKAGLDIITWTLERSGLLVKGGGFYYQSISKLIKNEGFTFELLDFLVQEVGVKGVFSDWPATTTYYQNCVLGKTKAN